MTSSSRSASGGLRLIRTVLLLLPALCSAQSVRPSFGPLTSRDVIKLAEAGFSEGFILQVIATAGSRFDMSVNGLVDLADCGLTEKIILAMKNSAHQRPKSAAGAGEQGADAYRFSQTTGFAGSVPPEPTLSVGVSTPVPAPPPGAPSAAHSSWLHSRLHPRTPTQKNQTLASGLYGQPIQISTSELPWGIVGSDYYVAIETSVDGRCPQMGTVGLSLSKGKLPRGLDIRGDYLVGTPREVGTFAISIRAANVCSEVVKPLELVITGKPILRISPEELSFSYKKGQQVAPQTIRVSATWPDLPYEVQADDMWLTVKSRAGRTPEEGAAFSADVVSVGIDAGKLTPGTYHSAIRLSTRSGVDSPTVAITLTVGP